MTDLWQLPREAVLGGVRYPIRWRWQDAMAVLRILDGEGEPWQRWFRAIDRFYEGRVPTEQLGAAARFLSDFLTAGQPARPGPKLLDWDADAMELISDINRVAGLEVRNTDAHWWTFLGWFHAIGEGQLSALVTVRRKLLRGERLTESEQLFYRQNRERIRLRAPDTEEKRALEARLRQ